MQIVYGFTLKLFCYKIKKLFFLFYFFGKQWLLFRLMLVRLYTVVPICNRELPFPSGLGGQFLQLFRVKPNALYSSIFLFL